MKQILVSGVVDYPTLAHGYDLTSIASGAVGAFKLNDTVDLLDGTAVADKNFQLVLGRGSNLTPFIIPEVDVKTLSVVKTVYSAGNTFSVKITCPAQATAATVDKHYTIILVKRGTVFNERNKWSFVITVKAGDTITANDLCSKFKTLIEANAENLNINVAASSALLSIAGQNTGEDFDVILTDNLSNITLTEVTGASAVNAGNIKHAVKAVCDAAYIKDIVQRCAAGKGFKYLAEDGSEIYPGYPEGINESVTYTLYTLRFAVPRVAAKQRDEVVYQTVHIAIPASVSAATAKWDVILGLSSPVAAQAEEE